MDNDEARKRHGVEPTHKKVKGFQPLQLNWGRLIIEAVCRPVATGPPRLLAFARPLSIYYTNLGMGGVIDAQLAAVGREQACQAEQIIAMAHGRGADELVHRGRKDFGFAALSFWRFRPNAASYFTYW